MSKDLNCRSEDYRSDVARGQAFRAHASRADVPFNCGWGGVPFTLAFGRLTVSLAVSLAMVLSVGALLGGCAAPPEEPVEVQAESKVAEQTLNRLTAAEEAEGWVLLFDGEDLSNWRGFLMAGLPDGWSVSEGEVRFAPPPEASEGESSNRSDLVTRETYRDFELALEYSVSPAGNSGIMFRVSEDQKRSYLTGPEFQILDNEGHPDGKRPETSVASNYALHPASESPIRPPGEFNRVRLRVQGDQVEHWLNGVKVVEYTLGSEDWRQRVQASKFADWGSYGQNEEGLIAIQDHGDPVRFRNIRIKTLATPSP